MLTGVILMLIAICSRWTNNFNVRLSYFLMISHSRNRWQKSDKWYDNKKIILL